MGALDGIAWDGIAWDGIRNLGNDDQALIFIYLFFIFFGLID